MLKFTNKHILTIIVSVVLLILLVLVGFYINKGKEETNQILLEEQHWFQDPMECADLQGQEQDVCYQSKAITEHDSSYCANIQTEDVFVSQDSCYNQLASLTRDKTICEKITRPEFKENCLELFNGENTD